MSCEPFPAFPISLRRPIADPADEVLTPYVTIATPTDGESPKYTMTAVQVPPDTASAMEDIHGVDVSWLHHSTRGKVPLTLAAPLPAMRIVVADVPD